MRDIGHRQRIALALIACELALPTWNARPYDPPGMQPRWADAPGRCIAGVREWFAGRVAVQELKKLKRELKGRDYPPHTSWSGYEWRWAPDGYEPDFDDAYYERPEPVWANSPPRHDFALVVDACYSLLIRAG